METTNFTFGGGSFEFSINGLVIALIFIGAIFYWLKKRKFKNKVKQLFKGAGLATKQDSGFAYPRYKLRSGFLFISDFNPQITELDFTAELLLAFSHLFETNFTRATYENRKIILKASKAKSVSFEKCHPKKLKPLHCFLGRDEDNKDFVLSILDLCSFLLLGGMGTGKSTLANRLISSLVQTSGEFKTFFFCKNKNDFKATPKSEFVSKDNLSLMLDTLTEIKEEVLKRQKQIEDRGFKNGVEAGMKPIFIVADECHSYLKQNGTTKEEKEQLIKIISIFKFLLLQGRSSLVILVFITPSAEKEDLDLNLRDCAFYFSSRLNSPRLSENLFGEPTAFLMPREKGLFCFTDKNRVRILKVAAE